MEVTSEVAAAEIRAQLNLPPNAFSTRAFEAADFLLLCDSMEVRDYIIRAESVGCPQFSLHFDPWSAGAVLREAPFLADVDVPGQAWEERTVTALLDGCGMIDEVDRDGQPPQYVMLPCFRLDARRRRHSGGALACGPGAGIWPAAAGLFFQAKVVGAQGFVV
jgi:hypothetical protein